MNKKLAALLIPLMLIPLAGFAYASWTTTVTKTYLLKAGIVKMDVIECLILDFPKFGGATCTVGVQTGPPYDTPVMIDAWNLQPCDWVIILLKIHIDGTCPVTITVTPDPMPVPELIYSYKVYVDDGNGVFEPDVDPEYVPGAALPACTYIWVWEAIHFDAQKNPLLMGEEFTFDVVITGTQADC